MERLGVLSLTLSALCHATEDTKKVLQAMVTVIPKNAQVESKSERMKGYYGNQILSLRMRIVSRTQAETCFAELWRSLESSERGFIQSRLGEFTDPSGSLFIRLDKGESYRGRIMLAEHETIKVEVRFGVHKMPWNLVLASVMEWIERNSESAQK